MMSSEPTENGQKERVGNLIFRSLGIPDAVRDVNRLRAAAYRLAHSAGLDISVEPNQSDGTRHRLDAAMAAVEAAVEAAGAGDLDEVFGGFGYLTEEEHASRLIAGTNERAYEDTLACSLELIRRIKAYVEDHPFEDSVGRPFS